MIESVPTSSLKISSTFVGAVATAAPSGGEDEISEACAAAGVAASPATKIAISAAATSGKGRRHRATHEENLTTFPTLSIVDGHCHCSVRATGSALIPVGGPIEDGG
jgi:hypothetical protein